MRRNVNTLEAIGAKKVITSCANCYRMLRWRYPKVLGSPTKFKVIHVSEFIKECIADGRLRIGQKFAERVTYHDPCNLSRLGGIVEEPREILRLFTTNFIEMPENRIDAPCCGGGGFMKELDDELRLRIASKRIMEAEKVGAEVLVSACPICKETLSDATKHMKSNMDTTDITELVARWMGIL
jgi:Fe-S oxidoreductase